MEKQDLVIIGGGAAGIFAAAIAAEKNRALKILVLEKTRQLLSKVRISGGGRCNVTHAQFDPKKLTGFYPRGHKELLGPFHTFQPQDMIAWLNKQGVTLKTEADGRIFPTTDSSQTIIDCLLHAAQSKGVHIETEAAVHSIEKKAEGFLVTFGKDKHLYTRTLVLATGSSPQGHALALSLGHTIQAPVPSLFTFNVPTSPLLDLSGITLKDVELKLMGTSLTQRGALLLTHFGFSGPSALKLSAWGARELHQCNYRLELRVNWIPDHNLESAFLLLKKEGVKNNPFSLPAQLYKRMLELVQIDPSSAAPHEKLQLLAKKLTDDRYQIEGKTTHKQEFVTCGGIPCKEIDFRTMESKKVPGLYFAGEIIDIDGVTGGFNFQNAWTTAFIATSNICNKLNDDLFNK